MRTPNVRGSHRDSQSDASKEDRLGLVIVGPRGESHISDSFARSCQISGTTFEQIESQSAFQGPALLRRLRWHLLGRTPLRLERFSESVVRTCREQRPRLLLSVGNAPLHRRALEQIAELGCRRAIFLTDDPWSPAQKANWFLSALPLYDFAFSPRRANLDDLSRIGVGQVFYLPFGWDPALSEDRVYSPEELRDYDADVSFVGGGDADRVPYIDALAQAGLRVALYGAQWERSAATRELTRGELPHSEFPKAVAAASLALCLVRRVNRDGHSMRTYEVAAVGGCMLAEDTAEHRAILGPEGEAAVYFRSIDEMVRKARWLLEHADVRARLASAVKYRIRVNSNTYDHRLAQILRTCDVL
jgi:spore maturation protein CgeB